jgi:uncharacterized paraquat-inducible protein A
MSKATVIQCKECNVWFRLSQGVFNGSTIICSRCDAISRHPAGKAIAHV